MGPACKDAVDFGLNSEKTTRYGATHLQKEFVDQLLVDLLREIRAVDGPLVLVTHFLKRG